MVHASSALHGKKRSRRGLEDAGPDLQESTLLGRAKRALRPLGPPVAPAPGREVADAEAEASEYDFDLPPRAPRTTQVKIEAAET